MFGRRRNAGDGDLASQQADLAVEASSGEPGAIPAGVTGPWDAAEPHPELPRVDLGSLQVPVLEGTDIQLVFAEQHGAWVTVRYQLSELQLQAFAAPKRAGIWDEVRGEIVNEIAGTGGRFEERAPDLHLLLRRQMQVVVLVAGDEFDIARVASGFPSDEPHCSELFTDDMVNVF